MISATDALMETALSRRSGAEKHDARQRRAGYGSEMFGIRQAVVNEPFLSLRAP